MTVTDFLHSVRARTDELAILGAPMEEEDLTEKILDGLGDEYKELVRAVQARDTSISFDELHEKLLSFEASLLANTKSEAGVHCNLPYRPPMATHSGTPSRTNRPPPRPYQGFCQICGIQGHTAKRCPSFQLVPVQSSTTSATPPANFATPWQPRAHYAANTTTNNPSWLGQFTHLSHWFCFSSIINHHFTLNDVLYDLRTGAILLTGNTKDGVYEWPAAQLASSPILAFSHVKTTSSNWHHRLECLSLPRPSTSKIYVSRHVQFVESVFPYTSLHTTLPRPNSTTISTWIPLSFLSLLPHHPSRKPSLHLQLALKDCLCSRLLHHQLPRPTSASSAPQPSPQPSLTTTEPQIPVPPPTQHCMTTRAKNNITKPIQKLNLHTHKPTFQNTTPT
ncbi:Retrovirus-related Pol polyprotein from transposon RE2 [Vitis vinifera]|uniref:Retrovirus-related Pol polyprotein from transposon RE2 n=1 Tax=Vitis vinifera TaxID=29760 RepID=A0A438H398_VITVI|nr:Retrovirus-related Pol polyprotein from transposon RE2 [Vitis vinifera]